MTETQWYDNKALFEMIQELKNQIVQLCLEVQKVNVNMTEFQKLCARLDDCENKLSTYEGQRQGGKDTWGYVVGGLGVLIAILSRLGG